MLQGEAEILDDIEFKKNIWMENWTIYYPQGYTDPDFTILKIKPNLLKGWYKGHLYYDFEEE
jgi:general stress protein 26